MRTWPLGLLCVAEATRRAGHEVRVLDLMQVDDPRSALERVIRDFSLDLIGMSVRNIDDQSMKDTQFYLEEIKKVVDECRRLSRAPVVLGGAGYSIFPEAALEYLTADMGIQGEGEIAFIDLLRKMENKEDITDVPGLYVAGTGLQRDRVFARDLDALPLPGADLTDLRGYDGPDFWLPVQTRRGCPMRCNYCSTAAIEGCAIRKRSPKEVVVWINTQVKSENRRFYFVDNIFNLPPSYAKSLCSEIADARLDISWRAIVYPARIDEPLVAAMAAAGCKEVSLGFESGSPEILHVMNKRFDPDNVRQARELFARHNIAVMGFLLLGGPLETKKTAEESLAFAESLNLDLLKVSVGIRIYPETALARSAVEDGIITADDNLLLPRFYMVPGLEDWLRETVQARAAGRPNWLV